MPFSRKREVSTSDPGSISSPIIFVVLIITVTWTYQGWTRYKTYRDDDEAWTALEVEVADRFSREPQYRNRHVHRLCIKNVSEIMTRIKNYNVSIAL